MVVMVVCVRRRGWSSSHNVSEKIIPDNPVSKMATTGRDNEAAGMWRVTVVLGPGCVLFGCDDDDDDAAPAATVHAKC